MPTTHPAIDPTAVKARISDTLQLPLAKLADERLLTDVVTEADASFVHGRSAVSCRRCAA